MEHPAPQEKGSVKADQEVHEADQVVHEADQVVHEAERKWPGSVQGYDGGV